MGGGSGTSTGGVSGWSRQYDTAGNAISKVATETKKLGTETEKTTKKIEKSVGWVERAVKGVKTWVGQLSRSHPVFTAFSTVLGGVLGGLKGMVTAFPLMVTGALALAPVIVALTGAIGALGSSLAFAVGGGGLLGAGLLGSFAVGLGSIAAVAKPAIKATEDYHKAVLNLNTALASGSPTAIRARQHQLDAIAKANPGVAKLSGNLVKFQTAWKKATAPGRADFFKLANDGIQTMRGLLPTLARETNLNTAALQDSFHKILQPFLDSNVFKGFISGLGGIFRANLPGFMTGLVNVFKGFASILKVLTPQLKNTGPAFEKFTGKFAKWAASAGGKSTIKEMGRAFSAWLDLVKQVARIIGTVIGTGAGSGTKEIGKWADKMKAAADALSKPASKKSLAGFMSKSIDDVNKLWPVLKQVAADLTGIYKVWKPLGSVVQTVIKAVPAQVIALGSVAWVLGKGGVGAVKGAQSVFKVFSKTKGDTPLNPLWVAIAGGEGVGGGGGAVSKIKGFAEKFLKGAAAGRVMSALRFGGPLAAELLLLKSMDWAQKGPPPSVPATASNRRGTPPAGFQTYNHRRYTVPKTVTNPNQILLGQQPVIHPINPAHYAHSATGPYSSGYGFPTPPLGPFGKVTGAEDPFKPFVSALPQKFNKPLAKALSQASGSFDTMSKQAGGSLTDIWNTASDTTDQIKKKLPQDSATTNQAVATNYAIAAGDVETSMQRHKIAVGDAMKAIAQLMSKAFQALGINSNIANKLAGQGWSLSQVNQGLSSGASAGLNTSGNAMGSTVGGNSYVPSAGARNVKAGTVLNATGGRLPGQPRGDHLPLMSRGGSLLGIADGGELVVNRHTEAKADKMLARFGTRLSSLVDGETRPHFAKGGRVGGYQTGGVVGEVNSLASAAGFNKTAIAGLLGNAMQESSLNPNTPGGGLWQQITNFGSGTGGSVAQQWATMLPQIAGLRNSMNRAGSPGAAAVIFEQGFEKAGIPALANRIKFANEAFAGQLGAGLTGGAGGVKIPVLKAPTVAGGGAVVAFGQAVINRITQGANQYLQAHGGGSGGGAVPGGAKGTVMDPSGRLVAGWIEPILNWARQHGWGGSVTSGYRSFADQTRIYNSGVRPAAVPGTSNHEGTVFPRGAVDVSDASQLSSVLSRSPYASTLVWAGSKDPVHFSHPHGGSYALGGRVPWFANGTDFIANRPQVIGVGDRPGGERVTVTPKGQSGIGGRGLHVEIHHIEVNRKGDVQKIVDEELRLLANTIESHL